MLSIAVGTSNALCTTQVLKYNLVTFFIYLHEISIY